MSSKLKGLGLALVAMMALGAVIAQGAQAVTHVFKSDATPYVLTGEYDNASEPDHFVTNTGVTYSCKSTKFEGTQESKELTSITVTPTFGNTTGSSECTETGFGTEFVYHTNHCAFVLSGTTDANGDAPVEIECSGTTENDITVTDPALGITLHIPAQKPTGGAHYTNIEEGAKKAITVHTTLEGIKFTCTPAGFTCELLGTTTKYTGTEKFKGYKDTGSKQEGTAKTTPTISEGEQINISVSPG
jgi:hypothetical protein